MHVCSHHSNTSAVKLPILSSPQIQETFMSQVPCLTGSRTEPWLHSQTEGCSLALLCAPLPSLPELRVTARHGKKPLTVTLWFKNAAYSIHTQHRTQKCCKTSQLSRLAWNKAISPLLLLRAQKLCPSCSLRFYLNFKKSGSCPQT